MAFARVAHCIPIKPLILHEAPIIIPVTGYAIAQNHKFETVAVPAETALALSMIDLNIKGVLVPKISATVTAKIDQKTYFLCGFEIYQINRSGVFGILIFVLISEAFSDISLYKKPIIPWGVPFSL